MYCGEQGYWDTSGQCRWSRPAFHNTEQFDLDQSDNLVKSLACFIEEYPPGEYEIYLIHPCSDWAYSDGDWETEKQFQDKVNELECEAIALSKKKEQNEVNKK